ncbi:MAG: hypothetical protein HUJ58_01495 [Erysipelotrichaceae bacterium]|nr:hypothetical protein [Erysipelotrichaceae bacterium]
MRKVLYSWCCIILAMAACGLLMFTSYDLQAKSGFYTEQRDVACKAVEFLNDGNSVKKLIAQQFVKDGVQLADTHTCFLVVYDSVNGVLYSSAKEGESMVIVPLNYAVEEKEDVWTPDDTHCYAMVSMSYKEGNLVVGKSIDYYYESRKTYKEEMLSLFATLSIAVLPVLLLLRVLFRIKE